MTVAPSDSEMLLLHALWKEQPLSAREVHDRLSPDRDWSLSTTRTLLDRMCTKALIVRAVAHGMTVYAPAEPKVAVIGGLVRRMQHLLGMEQPMVAAAFSGSTVLTPDEIEELEAFLAEEPRP